MPQISISIDVSNMEKALSFYANALACSVQRNGSEISKLSTDNVDIFLLEKASGSNPLPIGTDSRNYDRHWTPVHLDFSVDNIEQSLIAVLEFGGSHEGSESGDWGSIAYCADPFGNGFCLCQITK